MYCISLNYYINSKSNIPSLSYPGGIYRVDTYTKMIKLRPKRFSRSSSKLGSSGNNGGGTVKGGGGGEIKWELRPGGMLVQKRESIGEREGGEGLITVRVSTVSRWHDITIQATSTFGN